MKATVQNCNSYINIALPQTYRSQTTTHLYSAENFAGKSFYCTGLVEFPFMSFGLRDAAQTFLRFMDDVLRGLDFCFAYLDDILVSSRSLGDHE
jgi:hypothetical protein